MTDFFARNVLPMLHALSLRLEPLMTAQDGTELTRRAILLTARRRFETDGYGTTTIEAIAADVGVSSKTVYLAFSTKAALLRAVWDLALKGDEDPDDHECAEVHTTSTTRCRHGVRHHAVDARRPGSGFVARMSGACGTHVTLTARCPTPGRVRGRPGGKG